MKIVKCLLALMVALSVNSQLFASSGAGLRTASSKFFSKVGQTVAVSALGLALAAAPLQYVEAQGKTVEDLTAVVADDPAYRRGAMLLRVSIPPAAPAEGEEVAEDSEPREAAFHLAYIGGDGHGNSLLIGRERQSGINVGETLAKVAESSLYAWDGLVSAGLSVRAIDSFEDSTGDGYYNVVLLQVEGLDLAANYPPLKVSDEFPYADERDLEILAFRLFYSPYLDETELPGDKFSLRWMRCGSIPNPNQHLALLGFGVTSCGIVDELFSNGALLIHDEKLVALQSLDTDVRVDENDKPLSWLALNIPTRAMEYSQALGEVAAAVEAQGKLTTTWGALKQE
ncbi:MAG: hypothetical protein OYH77_07215 [Pseudomonadota bacterium]|nr:hypothetical protein [Pseudomonadota bacterium]